MTDLLQRFEQSIQNRDLCKRGGKILVAVSGGLDSMTLLHALVKVAAKYRWQLVVAHFNHQMRGRASDADERLVQKTAAVMRLRVVSKSTDVKAFAGKSKLSLEMAARKLRHEFLVRAAKKHGIRVVALAHHADDQVELFFLRLLRGAGGGGLAGMKWRSPSPADKTILLVRPLLDFSKDELLAFARENKIQFRNDATNFSSDLLRNRIRSELLPLFRKNYQSAMDKSVLRLMEITGAESDFVGEVAWRWLKTGRADLPVGPDPQQRVPARANFESLPIAIQRRVLLSQLAEAGVVADFELIESLRLAADCFVSVGLNMCVCRNKSGEIKLRTESKPAFDTNELPVHLSGRMGTTAFSGRHFRWRVEPVERFSLPRQMVGIESFDADKVGDNIILRHWRPGDRFQPIGLKSVAKLQNLFVNVRIPAARRRQLALATTTDGDIFWVEGLRIGERFKLIPQTKRRLVWQWSNLAV